VIEPLLQMSSLSAINLPVVEMGVYMINCIYTIHSMLSLYEYTDKKLEKLEAQIEANIDQLVNEQAYYILSKTDLLDAYKIIQNHDSKQRGPLGNMLGLDSNTLKSAMVFILIAFKLVYILFYFVFYAYEEQIRCLSIITRQLGHFSTQPYYWLEHSVE
jgi:hypothetical protein